MNLERSSSGNVVRFAPGAFSVPGIRFTTIMRKDIESEVMVEFRSWPAYKSDEFYRTTLEPYRQQSSRAVDILRETLRISFWGSAKQGRMQDF